MMNREGQDGFWEQERMVRTWFGLLRQAEPSSQLIETHVSWIVISGQYAYKIKKALYLDFLDYSDLATRRFYCREEIRLNRRTAPEIYLDVIQIGGDRSAPQLRADPPLEYAVRMRYFENDRQLDRLIERDVLDASHIDRLADAVGDFHASLQALPEEANNAHYGAADVQLHLVAENLQEVRKRLIDPDDIALWDEVKHAQIAEFMACRDCFAKRQRGGFVRECHGDLHMGNLVEIGGKVVLFDGIDFSPEYRWMDVMNDAAFAFMDLLHYGKNALAWRFLNRYLEKTGDYEGVALLRFYAAYRATVRAKVRLICLSQAGASMASDGVVRRYLRLARDLLVRRRPALVLTMGLPGAGKSVFARMAVGELHGICLRSDIERKRFAMDDASRYSENSRLQVYEHLLAKADVLLMAGMTVIVDAAFLRHSLRDMFAKLAKKRSIPFAIAWVVASLDTLYRRVTERQRLGSDVSEAGPEVLTLLKDRMEAPLPDEKAVTVRFVNEGPSGLDAAAPQWQTLRQLTGQRPARL